MLFAGPVFFQCLEVGGGSVTLVGLESVLWINPDHIRHDSIPHGLGHNGGHGDAKGLGVSLDDWVVRVPEFAHGFPVQEDQGCL